jgi:anaerobic magnesium-protoporphyrin IX monomethyl ester cyclase
VISGLEASKAVDAIFVNSPLKDYDHNPRLHDFTLPVLGLGYIATYASLSGFNVGVLDAEAHGLGVTQIAALINKHAPRWVGLNLLAPTYRNSVKIIRNVDPEIQVMLGGHHAKAMPMEILGDRDIPRIDALVLGEGELLVERLLADLATRENLPNVWWRGDRSLPQSGQATSEKEKSRLLAPEINQLPFIDRRFLAQDPFDAEDGRKEANIVGSRGCPYDCSFCGAAKSANPDITIRTRAPENILSEMRQLNAEYGVTSFRFVDDLFLAQPNFIKRCLPAFIEEKVSEKWVWDATGRINVLANANSSLLSLIKDAGCREIALGIESGSARMLEYIDKHITPEMTLKAVKELTARGINVKGYFILGFPTETQEDFDATVNLVMTLWDETCNAPGRFRCSVFEFRPYPGTPEWNRLLKTGLYNPNELLNYGHVDLTGKERKTLLLERDEFNFSVGVRFGEVPLTVVRETVAELMLTQKELLAAAA